MMNYKFFEYNIKCTYRLNNNDDNNNDNNKTEYFIIKKLAASESGNLKSIEHEFASWVNIAYGFICFLVNYMINYLKQKIRTDIKTFKIS
jgi:hypothetical protein